MNEPPEFFINMPIPATMYTAVCALLGGAQMAVRATGNSGPVANAKQDTAPSSDGNETAAQASPEPDGTGPTATTGASPSDDSGEVDTHGHPWSADLHASTKGQTKDGLWRMKVGVSRPDPLPGFPKDDPDTGTAPETSTTSATSPTATDQASDQPDTSGEDDEFAAFREAAAKSDANDTAAAASVPARTFTDADLGALCNQAVVKLGDPSPVKEIIAQFVPEGEVAHSRNIPEDRREEFAQAVEGKAGIEFTG